MNGPADSVQQYFNEEKAQLLFFIDSVIVHLEALAQNWEERIEDARAQIMALKARRWIGRIKLTRQWTEDYPVPTQEVPENERAELTFSEVIKKINDLPQLEKWDGFQSKVKGQLRRVETDLRRLWEELGQEFPASIESN